MTMSRVYPLTALCVHLLLGWGSLTRGGEVRDIQVTDTHRDDVAYTSHLLFPFTLVRSLLDCVQHCVRHRPPCKALTYLPLSRACQGHSLRMASADPGTDLPHARTFMVPLPAIPDWINSGCVANSSCEGQIPAAHVYPSDKLPVCFKRRCLCPFGYFYSLSQKLCDKDCPYTQMQSSYTMYPGSGIKGSNDYVFRGTVEQCKQKCIGKPDCANFEISRSKCLGSRVSVGEIDINDDPWDHYQRDCA